jgi:hypothetical protein
MVRVDAFAGTVMVKLPSSAVTEPLFCPFTVTEAPATPLPVGSVTLPDTVRWAKATTENNSNTSKQIV